MSRRLDSRLRATGTRFRLFAQPPILEAFARPETVWLSPPAGSIGPGPSDDRMYVVEPMAPKPPYGDDLYGENYQPPYRGPALPGVRAGVDGHFDHLRPGTAEFEAAHIYGTLRRVLDIWEDYFGRPIEWHFRQWYPELEIVPHLDWDNAHCGTGFIETGYGTSDEGVEHPYCLNFDVIAHEFGHAIIFSEVGTPSLEGATAEYMGFHESSSDLVALVSVMHYDTFVDHLLARSYGNLYAMNELNRIGELSETDQIRIASNAETMEDVVDVATPVTRLTQKQIHALGEPLTGALFDIFVEVFEQNLLDAGLIDPELDRLSRQVLSRPGDASRVQAGFEDAYRGHHEEFKVALLEARDYFGECLAATWDRLSADHLTFARVAAAFRASDQELAGGAFQAAISESFNWRGIDIGALAESDVSRFPGIGVTMPGRNGFSRLSYRERIDFQGPANARISRIPGRVVGFTNS